MGYCAQLFPGKMKALYDMSPGKIGSTKMTEHLLYLNLFLL